MDERSFYNWNVFAVFGCPEELVHPILGAEPDHVADGPEQSQQLFLSQVGHFEVVAVVIVFVIKRLVGELQLPRVVEGIDELQPVVIDGEVLIAVSQLGLYFPLSILQDHLARQPHEVRVELLLT